MNERSKETQVQKQGADEAVELTRDQPVFIPATDIFEKKDVIEVVSDMPGVDDKNVDVTLENNVLTIVGYQDTSEPEGMALVSRGYQAGVFRRQFTLSAQIDRSKIKARMAGGVLKVELPKAEAAQPKKIQVTAD